MWCKTIGCSLIISDEENVDSEFSSSIPSRKVQMYRPIRPAPENNYVLPEVNNSMDSLPPIPIVNPCDSDPVIERFLILCSACYFRLPLSVIFKCLLKKSRQMLTLK